MSVSPIQLLIEDRIRVLGLRRQDVARRAGYTNLSKGCRRLDELLAGDLHTTRGLIDRLPAALDVPAETVNEAVAETKRQRWAAEDAAWRAAFKPHGIILTEHERPTSITMAAISGADRKLWVDFEPGSPHLTYIRQALDAVKRRSPISFYGAAVGVIINYSPDEAVHTAHSRSAVALALARSMRLMASCSCLSSTTAIGAGSGIATVGCGASEGASTWGFPLAGRGAVAAPPRRVGHCTAWCLRCRSPG